MGPSAVPEKGEKEDKGDGNFPCERRRESLILQWRMEIENREPHLVPTYFCCAIQKNSADDQKSVNLQYITLGCLDDGTNESSTKNLMFQEFFLYTFYRLRALKTLYSHLCNFVKK